MMKLDLSGFVGCMNTDLGLNAVEEPVLFNVDTGATISIISDQGRITAFKLHYANSMFFVKPFSPMYDKIYRHFANEHLGFAMKYYNANLMEVV